MLLEKEAIIEKKNIQGFFMHESRENRLKIQFISHLKHLVCFSEKRIQIFLQVFCSIILETADHQQARDEIRTRNW